MKQTTEQYYCKENSIKPENLSAEDDEIIWMMEEYHQSQSPQPEQGVSEKLLIHFLDAIRAYEHESGESLAYDERESEEFVDIYLKDN